MKYCDNCGTPVDGEEKFCTTCSTKLNEPPATQPNTVTTATAPTTTTEAVYESKFTGGAFANFFIGLLTGIVTVITLFLAYPAMVCWKKRWEARNTYVNGRRLRFDGKALQLLGKFIVWMLLSLITFGIYYVFCMRVALEKWFTKHTHFAGSPENIDEDDTANGSEFDGNSLGLFGVNLLTFFVTAITLTLGSYWAHCYKERWFAKHTVIDGARLYFDGTGWQYFGKRICWYLLTLITFGIYSFWLIVKTKKWTILHTKVQAGAKLPPATVTTSQTNTNSGQTNNTPKNDIALIGLVLSCMVIPIGLAGLILSIIGLGRSKSLNGAGKTQAIVGIVIFVLTTVAIVGFNLYDLFFYKMN